MPTTKQAPASKGITVSRDELKSVLRTAEAGIDARSPRPEAKNVRLAISDGALRVEAARVGEMRVIGSVPKRGRIRKLDVQLPHKSFARVIEASGDEIVIELADDALELRSARRTLRLHTKPGEQFPREPRADGATDLAVVDGDGLATALGIACRCAASDEVRPIIRSVALDFEGDTLTLVATDSYRLCMLPLDIERLGSAPERPLLLNLDEAKALAKDLRREKPEQVKLACFETQRPGLVITYGNRQWTAYEVRGTYPEWRSLVPSDGARLEIDRNELDELLKGVAAVKGDRSGGARNDSVGALKFEFGTQTQARFEAPDIGELIEQLPSVHYEGEPLTVAFNPALLADALLVVEDETLRATIAGPTRPILFRSEDDAGYLLMPVRV